MPAPETPLLGEEGASPPPRPPSRSCMSEGNHRHDKGSAGDSQRTTLSDGRPAPPERVLELQSEDAVTPTRIASRGHQSGEALATFGHSAADRDADGGAKATRAITQAGLDGAIQAEITAAAGEKEEESEDEDESGLFQETVLFMNNNFHSLSSMRCTPAKTPQQPSQETVISSAIQTPHMPRSLEVTPVKKLPTGREMPAEGDSAGHLNQAEAGTASSDSKRFPTADTTASACCTVCVSPATTVNTHVPAASVSPLLTSQQCCCPNPRASTFAAATNTTAPTTPAASEYFFIDNHDGTAYLADASLQLDGSYVLGQTILLARSSATSEASPMSTARRNAAGAESPVVKMQSDADLPQQRAKVTHRPLRGARLTEVLSASMAAPFSPNSPVPHPIQSGAASPVSPSIARVLCRSAAPSRDNSSRPVASAAACRLRPSNFGESFCFDQTLLVPLDESADAGRSAVIVDASLVADQSYRSSAPARWEACASPTMVTPALSSAAVSFRTFQAGAEGRERGVPQLSPSCPAASFSSSFSVSRASPVPDAPIAAEQLASQQARATREKRTLRSDQDVIYLISADAVTETMTPDDITSQGWIPVQAVNALPAAAATTATAAGDNGRSHSFIGGGTESPLPKNPSTTTAAARVNSQGDCVDKFEREQSLSRRSYDGPGGSALPIFSPASTLSASTLECINRRLSYSISRWTSTRQACDAASPSDADGASGVNLAGSIALPLATSLFLAGHPHEQHHSNAGGSIQREASSLCWGNEKTFSGSFSTFAAEPTSDSHSPVPVPPELSETPQREQSPSRCTAVSIPIAALQRGRPVGAAGTDEDDTGDAAYVDWSSLMTSMRYQRPSTVGAATSESHANDGSLSIPLTSSASAILGTGALRPASGGRYAGGAATGVVALNHVTQQAPQHRRAPYPRRMSATGVSYGTTSSSVSLQAFGEHSQRMPTGAALSFSNAAGAAGNSSFRTTYCCNRTSITSTETASLNPGFGGGDGPGSSSVSAAGLPLSRGALPHHHPHHQHRYSQQRAGMVRIHSTGSLLAERSTAETAAMSVSGAAPRSGAVNRNSVLHRNHYASLHQQQYLRWTEATALVGAGPAAVGGRRASATAGFLVPDTSVFLPWAPLTITPEGSVNLGGSDETGRRSVAAATAGAPAPYVPMTLMPFTSSAETSTTTTTNSATCDAVSTREVAQQIADDLTRGDTVVSLAALRTLNTAVAAAMEMTMNQLQASLCAASTETEPEPAAPALPSSPYACKQDDESQKENRAAHFRTSCNPVGAALATGSAQRSRSVSATRPLGCWEGSATNIAARLSSKARSPSNPAPPGGAPLLGQQLPK
ncbi:hypothetical protein LMXM_17_0500 [Leishmania mexicana MHOM/GT/2001/U1103]|uniref:Uncharacterized protein n=1 Tax=Leishmania mexicana (strain MHOM/GT/2001/U1103) TaxID=929439 RepID=E9AR19_LEIMU|nr:hypothetical protein LMXM_17_0500 [Leishmania mexicana MHOM/GT/2001/U1103]CBZ25406.1 hypothetical protein LMXM_17_0500 [Leishmania mexicana MHOM/GT/2001/U1103]